MAERRTTSEINKDYKLCKKYVDEHPTITSLKEVAETVGLSESQVKTSLSQHPRVFNKIQKLIVCNQETLKAQKAAEVEAKRKAEQEALEAKKKAKAEAKQKAEIELINVQKNNKKTTVVKISKNANFVIDASISGIIGIMDTIKKICSTKSKIILTSVTIKELEMMQKYHDGDAYGARKILAMAAGNYDNFECVLIDENVGIPDDCIIKYCEDNKDNVVLLTSDKTMELKARTYGIQTLFFKQTKNTHTTTTPNSGIKVETIYAARRIGKKLIISDFGNNLKSIRVISDSIEYNTGVVELKIGDDIYIAVKKYDYVTFAHYNIVSLTAKNNCKLVCSKRFYNLSEIDNLPIASYKSFMRDFIHKID